MMADAILDIRGVEKVYENVTAVDAVSLEIRKGALFGLLGPNGAGKTTLIRMITNILRPDAGEIYFDGSPNPKNRMMRIGYMPEERGLYKKMKVGNHLLYLAQLKDLPKKEAKTKIAHWLERLNIADWADKKIEDLSKGMQQKIQFIATVLHEPELIILDEPFSGLDPVNANLIRDEIFALREKGASIVFSTHRMEQVEQLCEEIALINHGKIILSGGVGQIQNDFKKNQFSVRYEGDLPNLSDVDFEVLSNEKKELTLQLSDGQKGSDLLKKLLSAGVEITAFKEILPSLNEIFIRMVQGER